MNKICSTCNNIKSLVNFHKDKKGKYGVRGRCKLCRGEILKEYYERDDIKQRQKKYYKNYNIIYSIMRKNI